MGGSATAEQNPAGGTNSNFDPVTSQYNTAALQQWVKNTQQGQQFAETYGYLDGAEIYTNDNQSTFLAQGGSAPPGGVNISSMIQAFQNYTNDQGNANTAWQNYSDLVAEQAGGGGTQTILSGPQASTYQTILAAQQAQQGVGNPNTAQAIVTAAKGSS